MWKRVPAGRQNFLERFPLVAAKEEVSLNAELDSVARQRPDLSSKIENMQAQAREIISKYKQDPPLEFWYQSIQSNSGTQIANIVDGLLSMRWIFLYSEKLQFLTCDNPIFIFRDRGIGNPTSELTFPLSSSIALWASRKLTTEEPFLLASDASVKEINRRTAYNSTRFLYSKLNEAWILPFVRKGNWRLNQLG